MPATKTEYRQTGAICKIINRHENDWEDFAGADIRVPDYASDPANLAEEWEQGHWSYRGQAGAVSLPETWQVAMGSHITDGTLRAKALTGYTNRAATWLTSVGRMWVGDSNGPTTGIGLQTQTVAAGSNIGRTLEIMAATIGDEIIHIDGIGVTAATSTLPILAAKNDLAIVIAARASATPPTVPAGWTSHGSAVDGVYSNVVASKLLTVADIEANSIGTWTNATWVQVVIYRNALAVGINSATGGAAGTTITYPARTGLAGIGQIVRVRIGDGTNSDRQIYRQIITDPTIPTQWTTWSLLYSGTHYAVEIYLTNPSGAASLTYSVVHAKVDGIYVNNVLKFSQTNVIRIKPILFWANAIKFAVVGQDTDGEREIDWYQIDDITVPTTLLTDCANYRWYRYDQFSVYYNADSDQVTPPPGWDPVGWVDAVWVTRAIPENFPRSRSASQVMVSTWKQRFKDQFGHNQWDNVDYIKGPSGQSGFKSVDNIFITWDGRLDGKGTGDYYMLWNERHTDVYGSSLSNLQNPVFISKAYNLPGEKWSEPLPVGVTIWGTAGQFRLGDYWFLLGNSRAMRRPSVSTEIDLSNYVISGSYDLPRNSQPGSGELLLANPDNAVGSSLGLVSSTEAGETERSVDFAIGLKRANEEDWTWKYDSQWWLAGLGKTNEDAKDQVTIQLGDFWHRAEVPFREVINIPGKINWFDWDPGAPNLITNYGNSQGNEIFRTAETDTSYFMTARDGDTYFAPWRGENGFIGVLLDPTVASVRLFFRYQDASNYYFAEVSWLNKWLRIGVVQNGKTTQLYTQSNFPITSNARFAIDFRWKRITVYYNDEWMQPIIILTDPIPFKGFVGFAPTVDKDIPIIIRRFQFYEFNKKYTTGGLIGRLLSYVDPTVRWEIPSSEETLAEQILKVWGPQSDLETPAKALDELLESSKLELVFKDSVYTVGRFDVNIDNVDVAIENQVINQDQVIKTNERPNVVVVDGKKDSWTQYDKADLNLRQVAVNKYLDLPELETPGAVKDRAEKEIQDARRSTSPGGDLVWDPSLSRMEPAFWTDADSNRFLTRIEGLRVDFNQGLNPFQHAHVDAGTFMYCPPEAAAPTYLARDLFQRDTVTGWSNAQIGGNWVIS